MRPWWQAWVGVFGGGLLWYAAHDLSTYLMNLNCSQRWITPVIHVAALIGIGVCGGLSWRAMPESDATNAQRLNAFSARLGVAAAALFALVVVWQGIATLVFNGCER